MTIRKGLENKWNEEGQKAKNFMMNTQIYQFAAFWTLEMEHRIAKGEKIADIARECEMAVYEKYPKIDMTGSMYACAVAMAAHYWIYGDELREWHNQKYGYNGDGVVNSTIVSFG